MPRKDAEFIVAIDTREQQPYKYRDSVAATLRSGDYSILGHEADVGVERKTKEDAYGSLSSNEGRRERFEDEFGRLGAIRYGALVVEASLPDFLVAPEHSQMNPVAAVASLVAWSVRYRVPVWFAGDRRHAAALTYNILGKYHRMVTEREGE